jgi:hypothetical protein
MKKRKKSKFQPEFDDLDIIYPYQDDESDQDFDNIYNPGPTGHGPDICHSDADPGL